MKNKLFLFSFVLILTFLSVSFLRVRNASAQNSKFLVSTLTKIPGFKIEKDYGIFVFRNHMLESYSESSINISPAAGGITFSIQKHAPQGSNACINFKAVHFGSAGSICEFVKLVPKK